jgi:hypothetical protein
VGEHRVARGAANAFANPLDEHETYRDLPLVGEGQSRDREEIEA